MKNLGSLEAFNRCCLLQAQTFYLLLAARVGEGQGPEPPGFGKALTKSLSRRVRCKRIISKKNNFMSLLFFGVEFIFWVKIHGVFGWFWGEDNDLLKKRQATDHMS